MRKRMDNRIGRKADGKDQKIDERAFLPDDLAAFAEVADEARAQESDIEKKMMRILKRFPIYTEYLANVKGVGAIAAGHIISSFDIEKADTVSKLWQYAGMNPGMVRGKRRKDKPDGTFDIIETDTMIRGDRMTAGFVAPFNKTLRTALCGVLADGFLKAGIRGEDVTQDEYDSLPETWRRLNSKTKQPQKLVALTPQAKFYMDYKHRLACSEKETSEIKKGGKVDRKPWRECTAGHRDRAAKRYMIKMFLAELYEFWREMEGLPVRPPYQEEYLGHKHGKEGKAA